MAETFLAILTAHLAAEFLLRTRWMATHAKSNAGVTVTAGWKVILSAGLTGSLWPPLLAQLLVAHLAIGWARGRIRNETAPSFAIGHIVHAATLVAIAFAHSEAIQHGAWSRLGASDQALFFAGLTLACGVIIAVPMGGAFIREATEPFISQMAAIGTGGLKDGGLYIGLLERSLVVMFVLVNQPGGIGFLIAAKSILRFGEIQDPAHRKGTEYIIIGTLLSFGWAMLWAYLTLAAIRHWLPAFAAAAPAPGS